MSDIHPCEPNLGELKKIRQDLYGLESTELNVKKIKAIESQIARHESNIDSK